MSLSLVPFLRYFTSKTDVPLKSSFGVTQDHWKRHISTDRVRFSVRVLYSNAAPVGDDPARILTKYWYNQKLKECVTSGL